MYRSEDLDSPKNSGTSGSNELLSLKPQIFAELEEELSQIKNIEEYLQIKKNDLQNKQSNLVNKDEAIEILSYLIQDLKEFKSKLELSLYKLNEQLKIAEGEIQENLFQKEDLIRKLEQSQAARPKNIFWKYAERLIILSILGGFFGGLTGSVYVAVYGALLGVGIGLTFGSIFNWKIYSKHQ